MRNKPLPERPVGAVGSLDRGLQLLQVLRDYGDLRVVDAASLLGVSRSSAHRLLQTLVYRGFAMQDEGHVYYPGTALDASPARRAWIREFQQISEPHLQVLSRRSGESVNLMIRVGANVRFLQTVRANSASSTNDRAGIVMPAALNSGGKALLAEIPEDLLAQLYLESSGGENPFRLDEGRYQQLKRDLTGVRRRGFAVNFEETERGVAAMGVAIHDGAGQGVGAISVSTLASKFGAQMKSSLVGLVLAARDEIEHDLAATDLGENRDILSEQGVRQVDTEN